MNTISPKHTHHQTPCCQRKDSYAMGNRHIALLGYAGLLPFIGFTAATFFGYDIATAWFCIYSAIIVAFLAGNQWHPDNTGTVFLYHSNALAIVAAMALMIQPLSSLTSIMLLIVAYLWLLIIEYQQGSTCNYRAMRIRLSSIVVSLHLIILVV